MADAPFTVGQRVRMTAEAREQFSRFKTFAGVVTRGGTLFVCVLRDGMKASGPAWSVRCWEPVPPGDLSLDDACRQLAHAALAGDRAAALALADRVVELCGGTTSGGTGVNE